MLSFTRGYRHLPGIQSIIRENYIRLSTLKSASMASPLSSFSSSSSTSPFFISGFLRIISVSLCCLLLISSTLISATARERKGFDHYEGIGPGEDFGDYEDRYSAAEDEFGEEKGEEESIAENLEGVVELDALTFEKIIDGSKKAIVVFYASWDKFCKEIVPTLKETAKLLIPHKDCIIAKVDSDRSWKLGAKFDATELPHFVFFDKSDTLGITYEGARNGKAIVDFMLKGSSKRAVKKDELKRLAKKFMEEEGEVQRGKILARTEKAVGGLDTESLTEGQYYTKVMGSVLEKGDDFILKEMDRLKGLVEGKSLSEAKKLEFKRRIKVLKVFENHRHDEL